jgi:hypothetical protein
MCEIIGAVSESLADLIDANGHRPPSDPIAGFQ